MNRESFASRLGFIMVSVACAVGLGNIWLLPYRVGVYGGGVYLILFAGFLILLGVPVLIAEYAIGRASGQSIITAPKVLQPNRKGWQFVGWVGVAGNYLLTMFYSVVVGFTLAYMLKAIGGGISGLTPETSVSAFAAITSSPLATVGYTWAVIIMCLAVCFFGLRKGVERFGKNMMIIFFGLIVILMIRSVTLPGAAAGLRFLFIPRWAEAIATDGLPRLLHIAMGQAFFSLSVGIGSMAIFSSYIKKEKTLASEALPVAGLDIVASLLCLLMIFSAAFAFGISPGMGAGLLFIVMPNVLNAMPGTYFWSVLLYVSFFFVAVTTQLAVIENIVAMGMDKFGWNRKKSVFINLFLLLLLILPAALSQSGNVLFDVRILGMTFSGFFTFLVSDNLLPIGSIAYAIFCAYRFGWGWDDFLKEVNTGKGIKFPSSARFYYAYVIPIAGLFVYLFGLFHRFVVPLLG